VTAEGIRRVTGMESCRKRIPDAIEHLFSRIAFVVRALRITAYIKHSNLDDFFICLHSPFSPTTRFRPMLVYSLIGHYHSRSYGHLLRTRHDLVARSRRPAL